MSWDEKDWANTSINGTVENVRRAITALVDERVLYGHKTSTNFDGGKCTVSFYECSRDVDQLTYKEEMIYNEIATRFNVLINYTYLGHYYQNFPKDKL